MEGKKTTAIQNQLIHVFGCDTMDEVNGRENERQINNTHWMIDT